MRELEGIQIEGGLSLRWNFMGKESLTWHFLEKSELNIMSCLLDIAFR